MRDHSNKKKRMARMSRKFYDTESLLDKVIAEEKQLVSNPFLSTRIMSAINAIEQRTTGIPETKRILKPLLISLTVTAALVAGILAGSAYISFVTPSVPVEMTYINDAQMESVYLLSEN